MDWKEILKDYLSLSLQKKLVSKGMHEVFEKARFIPAFYILVWLPGFFLISGLILFVSYFLFDYFPQYVFPEQFIFALSLLCFVASIVGYAAYHFILSKFFNKKSESLNLNMPTLSESLDHVVAPLQQQYEHEHKLLLKMTSFYE